MGVQHAERIRGPSRPAAEDAAQGGALQARTRAAVAAGIRHQGRAGGSHQLLRQQLSRAGQRCRPDRGSPGKPVRGWFRHGIGPLHLRHQQHASQAGKAAGRVPGHGRCHPVFVLFRRERRSVRDPARRRGCGDLGRAQSRVDHRRGPPLQGEALSLCQQRHGRPRGPAQGRRRGGRALQADRDGWRVLHGWRDRPPARHLRSGRPSRCHGHGGRLHMPPASWVRRAAARTSTTT